MTKAKYKRPASPAEIALRRETARLASQGDVRVVANPAHQIVAAQRMDVFELLRQRKSISFSAYEAVRRLEREMAWAEGVDTAGPREAVDGGQARGGAFDHQVIYRAKVRAVLARLRPGSKALLEALLQPQFAGTLPRWRDTVATITGQTREEIQTDRVGEAARNLAEAYVSVDYMSRDRERKCA